MMKRKVMGALLTAAMVAGMLASVAVTASAEDGKQKLTVTFKDDGQGENHPWYVWVNSAYENWDLKDQYELEIATITGSESDYYTKVALELADANTCPDVVFEDTFQLPNDVSAGYLTNLDEYLAGYDAWNDGTYYDTMKAGSIAAD